MDSVTSTTLPTPSSPTIAVYIYLNYTYVYMHNEKARYCLFITHLPFSMAQQFLESQGLIIEVSRSHSDTPHSVGLFSTGDQTKAETCT